MKENKVLKVLSYILIPILVLIITITVIYESYINSKTEIDYENYFSSKEFVNNYMSNLSDFAGQLIYDRNDYSVISNYDNSTEVPIEIRYVDYNSVKIKDFYFLIIYKNIAITNVELNSYFDTIEKIKNYIQINEGTQKVNIINGILDSTSDIIKNRAMRNFENFTFEYYTKENSINNYITAKIQDFQIYSSYKEEIIENHQKDIVDDYMDNLSFINENVQVILPISCILLFLCIIYLMFSIGHTKGVNGIDMKSFDKVYFEILIVLALIFIGIAFLFGIGIGEISDDINVLSGGIASTYLICYTICAMIFNTFVKRIKAKMFWKTTIVYKMYINVFVKVKKVWDTIDKNIGRGKKLIIYIIGYFIGSIILVGLFNFVGLIILIGITCAILFDILKEISCFEKIENHLKEIYQGNTPSKLNEKDFTKNFQNEVKYINDISNGLENAVQAKIQSERLKTELITNVSHDIKTPLTSIINYADLLQKENIQNEKAKEYINVLVQKSNRLKKLMEGLIEASKASSGNINLNYEKINIIELLNQAIGEFKDKFEEKNLKIINKYSNNEVFINADSRYMYRIIENIFSNVSKYGLENSRVYIDVFEKNEKVYVYVKNISKESLNISEDELMQRFVRGDKSRTTEGSGLGISIAKSLTELQNGQFKINIDGDLFKVELKFKV